MQENQSFTSQQAQLIEECESLRQKLFNDGKRSGITIAGILIAVLSLIFTFMHLAIGAYVMAIVIGLITIPITITTKSTILSLHYKKNILSKYIESICANSKFEPEKGIPQRLFERSALFSQTPDIYSSEDLISGVKDKTAFCCSEVNAQYKKTTVDSKGQAQTTIVNIFNGFMFVADFNKHFNGNTTIFRNSWIKLSSEGERVKLENPLFEERFDTYTTDQTEARYLITPSLMERLIALDDKFPGKITLSFRDSLLIVAIPDDNNNFEASIWTRIDHHKVEKDTALMQLLIGVVEDLNLNTRIWSKE